MTVTWVTLQPNEGSYAHYGINSLNMTAKGFQEKFIDGGNESRVLYIHRVVMNELIPGNNYSL